MPIPIATSAGKIDSALFDSIIRPKLGRRRAELVVPPASGLDVGVIDIGNGNVLVTTTDPFFVWPDYGWERSAWFAVHIIASDCATSGLAPQYMTIDLNLPLTMSRDDLAALWTGVHQECDKLGIAIVTGHTGVYDNCAYPMIGSATIMAIGSKESYVTPAMATEGDHVIVTKGAAIETTALLGVAHYDYVSAQLGSKTADQARDLFWKLSVVDDALTAASVGVRGDGVTGMHDATERGLWGALFEVAQASNTGIDIYKEKILLPPAVREVCALYNIDPYSSSSEGSLVITCRSHKSSEVISRLADRDISATVIGELCPAEKGCWVHEGSSKRELTYPERDPFWEAFTRNTATGKYGR
ncbi:MAG: AIR synthase family protein [Candidatus Zixiibacteriota bacterium]